MTVEGVTVVAEGNGIQSFVPCVPGKTSDGHYTFEQLYMRIAILEEAVNAARKFLNSYDSTPQEIAQQLRALNQRVTATETPESLAELHTSLYAKYANPFEALNDLFPEEVDRQ